MPTTPSPEAVEALKLAANLMRPSLDHLPRKEAERRFAELAKMYYRLDTHLRAV